MFFLHIKLCLQEGTIGKSCTVRKTMLKADLSDFLFKACRCCLPTLTRLDPHRHLPADFALDTKKPLQVYRTATHKAIHGDELTFSTGLLLSYFSHCQSWRSLCLSTLRVQNVCEQRGILNPSCRHSRVSSMTARTTTSTVLKLCYVFVHSFDFLDHSFIMGMEARRAEQPFASVSTENLQVLMTFCLPAPLVQWPFARRCSRRT